jgi:phosphate transport system permease protein
MLSLMVGVLTCWSSCFADMAIRRAAPERSSSSPTSRRACRQAGILSAWVGSILVMLVTACAAVPLGVAAGHLSGGVRAKELVHRHHRDQHHQPGGVPSIVYGLLALGLFVYTFGFGQSILSAGLTLALLILPIVIVATREAHPLHSAAHPRGPTPAARRAGRWSRPHAAVRHARHPDRRDHRLARAIGETAPIITIGALTFIAFLPPVPFTGEPDGGPVRLAVLALHRDADPDLQLDLAPRSGLPPVNAAAAGFVLMAHDAGHERAWPSGCATAAQEHQVVSTRCNCLTANDH